MVKDNGESYYAISSEFDLHQANDWLKENVLSKIHPLEERKPLSVIKKELMEFIGFEIPEIWAWYNTFDWLAILWLYGGFQKLPYNFPGYCKELRQEVDRTGFPEELFPLNLNHHHALADAQWARELHQAMITYHQKD